MGKGDAVLVRGILHSKALSKIIILNTDKLSSLLTVHQTKIRHIEMQLRSATLIVLLDY